MSRKDGTAERATSTDLIERMESSRRSFLRLAGAAGATALGVSAMDSVAGVPVREADITEREALDAVEYGLEHPRVYHAPEDMKVARINAETTEWGRQSKESVVETARKWPFVGMGEEELRSLAPVAAPDGTTYYTAASEDGVLRNGNVSPVDGSDLRIDYEQPGTVVDESGNVFPGEVDGSTLRTNSCFPHTS